MARGINKVIIVGNLGQDPEMRTFPDGGALTNISVATSEAWTDKVSGEKKERTEWHRVQFNGRLAEVAHQYLRKGSKVYVEGSLRTRKFQDKVTGTDRYSTDIVGRTMQMLDARDPGAENLTTPQHIQVNSQPRAQPAGRAYQDAQQGNAQSQAQNMQHPQQAVTQGVNRPVTTAHQNQASEPMPDFDDDIPF